MIFPAPPEKPQRQNPKGAGFPVLITIGVVILILLAYFVIRQVYIDTHCVMILGTMICK
jgi:hypothetical protein